MAGSDEWVKMQEQQRANELAKAEHAQAMKNVGRPDRPEWDSLLGDDGLMQSQYQLGNNLNTGYLEQMRKDGLRDPGTQSRWRQLMEQKVQGMAGDASAGAQAQTRNQMSNLAMMGGLRGGAAERLASSGARRATMAQQDIMGQRLGLDLQDEQMRNQQLAQLGNAEMGAAQFQRQGDQFNVQTALNENLQKRAEAINAYNEQMRAWAAEKTAAATPSGGGGKK
jgi:hypothetical protein